MDPLKNIRETIREHWREHLPRMFQELESSGELADAIEDAVQKTEAAVAQLVKHDTHPWDAWIEVREEWAILLAEETDYPVEHVDNWMWLWDDQNVEG